MATGQLDLFDTTDYDAQDAANAAWIARMIRADWIAPYDCAGGLKEGDVVLGWQCPACGTIEINEFILSINHGIDPHLPGTEARLATCTSMQAYTRRRANGAAV